MINSTDLSPIGREALDTRACDDHVARATLMDIALSNRWFGGLAAVHYGVDALLGGSVCDVTILDVGAGMGDVAKSLGERFGSRGHRVDTITVDWHHEAARLCASQGLPAGVADAAALPFGDGSVDITVASQLLHHFTREAAIRLVHEFLRVARRGVVIADLRRSHAAIAGIWLASRICRFHPASQHDGVLSIRRGFTLGELTRFLADAGLSAKVVGRPGFRLVATIRKHGAGATGGARGPAGGHAYG